jgi:hypothetical protein
METSHKQIFGGMAVIAGFLVCVIVSQLYNAGRKDGEQKIHVEKISKLQFKGRVTGSKRYTYFRKNFYRVCVTLDSSSVKSLYIYNNRDCIKINNGVATFSAGFLDPKSGIADSVAANIHNSGKLIFYYPNRSRQEVPLGFNARGLTESDLKACD